MSKDPTARERIKRYRADMKAMGYKSFATMLPSDRIDWIKQQKKTMRLASTGDALDALLSELVELRQFKEQLSTRA